ncbi:MAG: hypothetical protein LBF90_06320 [Prevotellaceae bacterium]|nr:hypothetical protein [Prevotellaceae bacterium]
MTQTLKTRLPALIFLLAAIGFADVVGRDAVGYRTLDPSCPVEWEGDRIVFQGRRIDLSPHAFFVDGRLTTDEIADRPFVFNSLNDALAQVVDGSTDQPMTVYIAPYVYWIDDPDDPAVRIAADGQDAPVGLTVRCNHLTLYGLTDNPQHVVLACNRGQTLGAQGNFTMFSFIGDDLRVENLTMGNYCNVDLEYPLQPSLSRAKRSPTIVQAQLAFCRGDRILARRVHFISRLNTKPLLGGKRTLFDRCHIECTDDALCPTGVYLHSSFTFFSSKPFARTAGTGALFLDCDFDVRTRHRQYLVKGEGRVTLVDARFHHPSDSLWIGWTQDPPDDLRNYQYNVTLNGQPVAINRDKPALAVDMTDKPLLAAYRFEDGGDVVYNTYNLLRGDDEWDPMGVKTRVEAAERRAGVRLTAIPVSLQLSPTRAFVEAGAIDLTLDAASFRFGNYRTASAPLTWRVSQGDTSLVALQADGEQCRVLSLNGREEPENVVITVADPSGLEAAAVIAVAPARLPPPVFTAPPAIVAGKGSLRVAYTLALDGRRDESLITWYRCREASGADAIPVAVTRRGRPEYVYELSQADAGYYIMATVAPKHLRSPSGKIEKAITEAPIVPEQTVWRNLYTDFHSFPVDFQPEKRPGFWTVDAYKPLELDDENWTPVPENAWEYGPELNGAKGMGLVQTGRGARLLYTPVERPYGDMSLSLQVDPCKQAGQGFSIAGKGQYMDIYIKFDPLTLTGYALRIIRTLKFDRAVDFYLVKYENGRTTPLCEPVSTTCYRTGCTITLRIEGDRFTAHAESPTIPDGDPIPGLVPVVDLYALITPNPFGGTGIQYAASARGTSNTFESGSAMLHRLDVRWSSEQ